MTFYTATGNIVPKSNKNNKLTLTSIEYKADGSLIIEKDEKDVTKQSLTLPNKRKLFKIKSNNPICEEE